MSYSAKVDKLLKPLRFFSIEHKKMIKPLADLAQKQHEDIKKLEQALWELKQPTLLDKPPDKYGGNASTLLGVEQLKYTLADHCKSILARWGFDSTQCKAFMKRKDMTSARFLELAKGEQDENM